MSYLLVVEDEPSLRLLYEMELRRAGFPAKTAASTQQCLDCLATEMPDLIIMETRMAGMNSVELLRQIRIRDQGVSVICNSASPGSCADCLARGADACLVKSADLTELIDTIKRLLSVDRSCGHAPISPVGARTSGNRRKQNVRHTS